MRIDEIKRCDYNPRKFSKKAKEALKSSIDEFGDISGIVWNKTTGNLVGGNHRFDEIKQKFGEDTLTLAKIKDTEFYSILSNDEFTGYMLREVEWDLDKEKMANITANSELVEGSFTDELQDVLNSIDLSSSSKVFKSLRLDELKTDIPDFDSMDFSDSGDDSVSFDSSNDVEKDEPSSKFNHQCPSCGFEFK